MTLDQNVTTAEQTRAGGDLLQLAIAGVKVNFRWSPAGTFMMGSPEGEQGRFDNELLHEVTLTQGFWIAETPTTQELWHAVMGNNPSRFKDIKQAPVNRVSWNDCHDFVEKLNNAYSDALPYGYRYAMPTEAQWEYACRAGTTTPFSFGSVLKGDKAKCDERFPYGTSEQGQWLHSATPVKSYVPNPWGLYDMHGNVEEWCADWFDKDFYSTPEATIDPKGPASGSERVLRGGSWGSVAGRCRSAYRDGYAPRGRSSLSGFRLVLVLG